MSALKYSSKYSIYTTRGVEYSISSLVASISIGMYIHYGVDEIGSLGMYILCRYGALGFGLSVAAAAQDGSATATFYIHIHTYMQYALHTYVHMHCFHGYHRKDT